MFIEVPMGGLVRDYLPEHEHLKGRCSWTSPAWVRLLEAVSLRLSVQLAGSCVGSKKLFSIAPIMLVKALHPQQLFTASITWVTGPLNTCEFQLLKHVVCLLPESHEPLLSFLAKAAVQPECSPQTSDNTVKYHQNLPS